MRSESFMELSLISAFFDVLLGFLGFFIGMILSFGISGFLNFIVGTLFGRKVLRFKYLIFAYFKGSTFHISNFSPVCEIVMTKENETKFRENAYAVIYISLHIITCILFALFGGYVMINGIFPIYIRFFTIGVCLYFLFDIFLRTYILIRSVIDKDDFLKTQCRRIISELMSDKLFGEIDVPDLRSIAQPLNKGKLPIYLHLFFINRLWFEDEDGMEYAVESMEKELQINYGSTEKVYLQQYTDAYYDTMFYYCHIKYNEWRAKNIYEIIAPYLQNEKDSKGYCTLAYDTYYLLEDGMKYAVESIEKKLQINQGITEKAYLQQYTDAYYDILFYYCCIAYNPWRAKNIYKIIAPDLLNDKDSNGYRTLAYYTYYVLKDSEKAAMYLDEALKLLDSFPLVSQRELEKKLIEELQSEISRNNKS